MQTRQLKFNLQDKTHGGRRNHAGRKRKMARGCGHQKRERINQRTPLHVTIKVIQEKAHLRNKQILKLLKRSIKISQNKNFKVIHFSLQYDHIHFIIEANSNHDLTLGMRKISISLAKNINKNRQKSGKVLNHRYHLHILKTLAEVKNAVNYVVRNIDKHLKKVILKDYFSSVVQKEMVAQPQSWFLKQIT